jgi:hexosaminidase
VQKLTIIAAVFCLLTAIRGEASSGPSLVGPSVLPLPQVMQIQKGAPYTVSNGASILAQAPESQWSAQYLADITARTNGLKLVVKTETSSALPAIQFLKGLNENAKPEAYSISVSAAQGVIVRATTQAGFFYGAVTLYQLLTSDPSLSHLGLLQPMEIRDEPALTWRGFLLDSGRHFQPASYIYHVIDLMGLHKLNRLHWHLTEDQGWRIEIKKYPRLTDFGSKRIDPNTGKEYGGYYTQDELRKIVKYAQDRNVTIVPEFELPGHASAAVVSYPQIASIANVPKDIQTDFGILPYLMNPASPQTYEFIHDVLDEIMDIFPGQIIHIGGDEAMKDEWKTNPDIQALMRKVGVKDEIALQDWFMGEIGKYIESRGRTAMGYFYPGANPIRPSMPVEVYLPANPIKKLLHEGHDLVNLMWPEMYFDEKLSDKFSAPEGVEDVNPLAQVYGFNPFIDGLTPAERSHVLGLEGALWTEDVPTAEIADTLTFPRELAVAEVGWTQSSRRNWPDFVRRLAGEYNRFQKLGLTISDIPFRPVVRQKSSTSNREIHIGVSNQTKFGEFRFTKNGAEPTAKSPLLTALTPFSPHARVKVATFTRDGLKLSETVSIQVKEPTSVR